MFSRLAVLIATLATNNVVWASEKVSSNRKLPISGIDFWITEFPSIVPGDGGVSDYQFALSGTVDSTDGGELSYSYEVADAAGMVLFADNVENSNVPPGAIITEISATFQLGCVGGLLVGNVGESALSTSLLTVTLTQTIDGVEKSPLNQYVMESPDTVTCDSPPVSDPLQAEPLQMLGNTGGSFGDPHIKKWNGIRFDYHGECDLVLLKNPSFANGLGLDLHIRTQIREDWSFISSAAVKIGSDIIEVSSKSMRYLNGSFNAKMPASLAGFPVTYSPPFKDGDKWHMFTVDLGDGQSIVIKSFKRKDFVHVTVNSARKEHFGDSVGLMGEFGTGKMFMRDGVTAEEDPNTFSQDWQVLESEPHLFHDNRFPQHPQKCTLPEQKNQDAEVSRRRLGESIAYSAAEKACAEWDEIDREDCIFDVMATGDLELADAGSY